MAIDLSLSCACGEIQGIARRVDPRRGNHIVCHCDDCQAYAHVLGDATRTLDDHGGTEIYQISPADVAFTAGACNLAVLRLRDKGLLRWYSRCCRTPIGNTMATRQLPFVGLVHRAWDPEGDGGPFDAWMGPPRRIHTRFATGRTASLEDDGVARLLFRSLTGIVAARLRGAHTQTPFFDPATGLPVAIPETIDPAALQRAMAPRDDADAPPE